LYALLNIPGFPITEVKLTDVLVRVKVVAMGLEQVTVSLPVRSYAEIVFVLVVAIVAVVVG